MEKKNFKMLSDDFFNRSSLVVAKDLLGKYLVRKVGNKISQHKIIEVEAYGGLNDKASHASRGKTERNSPMFGEAGTIYVYFTYGMHWMLNIVCREKGYPAAVLIRGLEDVSGPARLTKKLKIDKKLNRLKLGKKTGLWFVASTATHREGGKKIKYIRTPRIGVAYAGEWAQKPYRFVLV